MGRIDLGTAAWDIPVWRLDVNNNMLQSRHPLVKDFCSLVNFRRFLEKEALPQSVNPRVEIFLGQVPVAARSFILNVVRACFHRTTGRHASLSRLRSGKSCDWMFFDTVESDVEELMRLSKRIVFTSDGNAYFAETEEDAEMLQTMADDRDKVLLRAHELRGADPRKGTRPLVVERCKNQCEMRLRWYWHWRGTRPLVVEVAKAKRFQPKALNAPTNN